MFKNCITASIFTANPENEVIFQKFESLFEVLWSNRTVDWSITRPKFKELRITEISDYNWNMTVDIWKIFTSAFVHYNADIKFEMFNRSIIIDICNDNFSICIIINFNI